MCFILNKKENDIWNKTYFKKQLQQGNDLGERMLNAFKFLLEKNIKK